MILNLIKFIFKSISIFLFIYPVQIIFQTISEIRNILFNLKIKKINQLSIPVISVGNLTFGGTGKTPFIQFLVTEVLNDKNIILVCKSYKADLKQPALVDLKTTQAAERFGDEACLLQKKLPTVAVWSGPNKAQTAMAAVKALKSQNKSNNSILIVDDGFSHRALYRNFNIVLFDSTKLDKDYLREFFKNIKRADAVIITKIKNFNNGFTNEIQIFKNKVIKLAPHLKNNFYLCSENFSIPFEPNYPVYAFCGLAKSENFKQSLKDQGYQVSFFEDFKDHQHYDLKLQIEILNRFKKEKEIQPQLKLVTTEKDAIKLTDDELKKNIHVINYSFTMSKLDLKQLKESLLEKIRTYS